MRSNERGVAIITVVLILLLLTVLGLAASVMMTQEDSTSGRMDQQRAALYVAEAGLRRGEAILHTVSYTNINLNQLINHATTTATVSAQPQVPQIPSNNQDYTLTKLGTYLTTTPGGSTELANQPLVSGSTGTAGRRAFYSVYVRNNPEDTSPTVNSVPILRLISVGWISQDGRPLAVKVLEEEFNYSGVSQSPSSQKQTNQGGTGSALYGG
jgi:Tfp pilus assembly protein PilX